MIQGWVKLHRKLLEDDLWNDSTPEQKVIMITLILMANHTENEWEFNGETYNCKPGEFVTSLKSIQEYAGKDISIMQIRQSLTKLEKNNFITNVSSKKNRIIKIVNWELYQEEEKEKEVSKKQKTEKTKEIKHTPEIKQVKEEWNKLPKSISKVEKIAAGTKRYKQLNARINEYGIDKVLDCIKEVEKSKFLQGGNNRNWRITLDWIIEPGNFIKVLEGKYRDTEENYGYRTRQNNEKNGKTERKYKIEYDVE